MAAETDNPVKFELAGEQYDLPVLGDLDIDEWMIVYEYSKVGIADLQQLDDPDDEAARLEKLNNPGLWKALAHIGYRRSHPKQTNSTVKAIVGAAKLVPMLQSMDMGEEAEEAADPTSATEPERSSNTSSDSSNGNSSPASSESSETPDDLPATIGTSG